MDRQNTLDIVRRTALENGGVPLKDYVVTIDYPNKVIMLEKP